MTPRTLILLIAVTAVLTVGGLVFYQFDAPPSETAVEGQLVFPELMDAINDAAELEIATSDGSFTVRREGDSWGLVERGGYPVLLDKVRTTLVGLAELEKLEQKTDNPALYEKLGVQSVSEDSPAEVPSKSVTVKDAQGAPLAALIVGKTRSAGSGATFYVRLPGEAASWLVEGERPPLPQKGDEWLDKKVLELSRNDVRAARTTQADGEVLEIAKKDSDTDFTVLGKPEDRELMYASVAGGIAGSMQYLNFEDVKPIDEFERPEAPVAITSLWTKDGMRMTVEVFEPDEETTWAIFHADYDPEGGPQLPVPAGPLPEDDAAEGKTAQAEATPRPEAEVRAEIDELNARLSKWAYELPQYSKTNFTKRLEDLLMDLPEETEPETPPPGDGGAALDVLEGPAPDIAPGETAPEETAPEDTAPENDPATPDDTDTPDADNTPDDPPAEDQTPDSPEDPPDGDGR